MNRKRVLCPYCNNGTGKHKELRAWLLGLDVHEKGTGFTCFNCGVKKHAELYYKYIGESYNDFEVKSNIFDLSKLDELSKTKITVQSVDEIVFFDEEQLNIISENSHDRHSEINKFIKQRGLPESSRKYLSYTNNFMKIYKEINNKDYTLFGNDQRILINYYKDGKLYGIKARAINKKSSIKYLTLHNDNDMFFNEFDIDFSKDVYIVEGEIDSLFIQNCISLGSIHRIDSLLNRYDKTFTRKRLHFVLDNDTEGLKYMIRLLDMKHNVFNWKWYLQQFDYGNYIKDVNDLFVEGYGTTDWKSYTSNSPIMGFDYCVY